jgi:hypothetical protein
VSDAPAAGDPDLLAGGWERRFVAEEARAVEAARLYDDLGYQTLLRPVQPGDMGDACGDCRLLAFRRLVTIYTRRETSRAAAGGREQAT